MASSHTMHHAGAEGEESSDELTHRLPPIQQPPRPHCRSCGRNDRPIFSSVCGWCSDRE